MDGCHDRLTRGDLDDISIWKPQNARKKHDDKEKEGVCNNLPHRHPIPSANCRLQGALAPLTNLFLQVTGAPVREMALLSLTTPAPPQSKKLDTMESH
jgi:hypothetical protein